MSQPIENNHSIDLSNTEGEEEEYSTSSSSDEVEIVGVSVDRLRPDRTQELELQVRQAERRLQYLSNKLAKEKSEERKRDPLKARQRRLDQLREKLNQQREKLDADIQKLEEGMCD